MLDRGKLLAYAVIDMSVSPPVLISGWQVLPLVEVTPLQVVRVTPAPAAGVGLLQNVAAPALQNGACLAQVQVCSESGANARLGVCTTDNSGAAPFANVATLDMAGALANARPQPMVVTFWRLSPPGAGG